MDGDLQFEDIGKHCELPECKQKDFLPFKCPGCKGTFCLEHRTYASHSCKNPNIKDAQAIFCPLCNQNVAVKPGEDPNDKLSIHIDKGCPPPKQIAVNKCNVKGCKQREMIPINCNRCKLNYCLRHRHETDHTCPGTPQTKKTTAAKKSTTPNKPPTKQNTSTKQNKPPTKQTNDISVLKNPPRNSVPNRQNTPNNNRQQDGWNCIIS
eukprot:TRINITY_DN8735_c0_g1_i1.p1 TRINITY_DN8735_c0_g1~~TRINITY_DN8735_c0_g1_i1.p1  ORF type:complete len:208 (+),score=26.50 TRINITY_DN8735_c0_g1_i1:46-669(+)